MRDAHFLINKAYSELLYVYPQARIADAKITYDLASMEMRDSKTWDASKARGLLEKMIKQLNQPQPIPPQKPATQPVRPPLPVGQPLQNPQLAPQPRDFFNLKQPLPPGQK